MATYYVGTGAGDFATINDAISAAAEGDVIIVKGSEYTAANEKVIINKGLTIQAEGNVSVDAFVLKIAAGTPAVSIEGFTIKPTRNTSTGNSWKDGAYGILQAGTSLKSLNVENCNFDLTEVDTLDGVNVAYGIFLSNNFCGMNSLTVSDCTFTGSGSDAEIDTQAVYAAFQTNVDFSGNTVSDMSGHAVQLSLTGEFYGYNGEATVKMNGNNISNIGSTALYSADYQNNNTVVEITDNVVNNIQTNGAHEYLAAFRLGAPVLSGLTITGNSVNGANAGVYHNVTIKEGSEGTVDISNNSFILTDGVSYSTGNAMPASAVNSYINGTIVPSTPENNTLVVVESATSIIVDDSFTAADGEIVTVDGKNYIIGVNAFTSIKAAVNAASTTDETVITVMGGTYADDITFRSAVQKDGKEVVGEQKGNIVIKGAEGEDVIVSGTYTLGYHEKRVGAARWNANIAFENITFDHAAAATHSIDLQDVAGFSMTGCTIVGDGEFGMTATNDDGTANITGCTFKDAGLQIIGNFGTGLVFDGCIFDDGKLNVQSGDLVTIKNSVFNSTVTDANVGDSFYAIRSNNNAIVIVGCTFNVDSALTEDAGEQAKWGVLWQRKEGSTKWVATDITVNFTEAAMAQSGLVFSKNETSVAANEADRFTVYGINSDSDIAEILAKGEGTLIVLNDGSYYTYVNGELQGEAVSLSTLYINKDFTSENLSAGQVLGVNAFTNVNDLAKLHKDQVAVNGDVIQFLSGNIEIAEGTEVAGKIFLGSRDGYGTTLADNGENVLELVVKGTLTNTNSGTNYMWVGSEKAYDTADAATRFTLIVDGGTVNAASDTGLNIRGCGELVVKNGGKLNVSGLSTKYSSVTVTGEGSVVNATNYINVKDDTEFVFSDGAKLELVFDWNGSIGVLNVYEGNSVKFDGASIVALHEPCKVINNGTFELVNGASLDFTNRAAIENFSAGTFENNGTLNIDSKSTFVADTITGSGNIVIDATDFAGAQKVIDLAGKTSLEGKITLVNGGDTVVVYGADGDVTLVNINTDTIYVDKDWAGVVAGTEVEAGKVIGVNAFAASKEAFIAARDQAGTVTIDVNGVGTDNVAGTVGFNNAGTYTITGGEGKDSTIYGLYGNNAEADIVLQDAFFKVGKNYFNKGSVTVNDSIIGTTAYSGSGSGWWTAMYADMVFNNSIVGLNFNNYASNEDILEMAENRSAEDVAALGEYLKVGNNNSGPLFGTFGSVEVNDSTLLTGWMSVIDRAMVEVNNSVLYYGGTIAIGSGIADNGKNSNTCGWDGISWGKSASDFRVGEAATLNITDSTVLNVGWGNGNDGASVQVGGSYGGKDYAGVMNITNSTVDLSNGGLNGAAMPYDLLVIKSCGTVNVANSTVITATVENAGMINIDAASLLKAGTLTGEGMITIDATDFNGVKKVIDLAGAVSLQSMYESGKLVVENAPENIELVFGNDGDVLLSTVDKSTSYINKEWATKALGDDLGNGKFFGINAFADFETAIKAAAEDTVITRLELESDIDQTKLVNAGELYNITQDLVIGVAQGGKFTVQLPTNGSFSIYQMGNNSSVKIEDGVVINGLDVLANGFYTNNNKLVIDGVVDALTLKQWTSNNEIIISETGKVNLRKHDGQFDMAYGNGSMTVNGNLENTDDESLTDGPQFQAGYSGTRGNGNTLNLNNTYVEAGAWFDIAGSNGTFNLNNSVLKISGGDLPGKLTVSNTGNDINVEDGSRLIVNTATIGADNTLDVDGGTLEIATLTNNGTVNVTGESKLNITTLNGDRIRLVDGAVITDSYVGGNVGLYSGENSFKGENTVTGTFSAGYNNYKQGDLTLNITGTFTNSNFLTWNIDGSETTVNIGDANADRTAFNGGQIGVFENTTININNADVSYNYTFIRANVNVTNSVLTNTNSDTYTGGEAVIVVDNSTWNAGGYTRFGEYSGMYGNTDVTLKNGTTFNAGDLRLIEAEGKTVKLTVDGSVLNVTNAEKEFNIGSGAEVEFKNGSTLDAAGKVTNNGTITVDSSAFTAAGILANNGSFAVSGDSKVNVATVNGNIVTIADKTTLTDSVIGGTVEMLGDLAIVGTLTVNGLRASNGGNLTGGTLYSDYAMFQKGIYTIDADLELDYGFLSYAGQFMVNSTVHTTGTKSGEVLYLNGAVDVNDGGVLDADKGIWVNNAGAVVTVNKGGKVETAGINVKFAEAQFNVEGGTVNTGAFENAGKIKVTSGKLNISETQTDNGKFALANNGSVALSDGELKADGLVKNNGSIAVSGGKYSSKDVANNGEIAVSGGSFAAANINGNGEIAVSGGTFTAADITDNSKIAVSDGAFTANNIANANTVAVSGGSFKSADITNAGAVEVTGGTFEAGNIGAGTVAVDNAEFKSADITAAGAVTAASAEFTAANITAAGAVSAADSVFTAENISASEVAVTESEFTAANITAAGAVNVTDSEFTAADIIAGSVTVADSEFTAADITTGAVDVTDSEFVAADITATGAVNVTNGSFTADSVATGNFNVTGEVALDIDAFEGKINVSDATLTGNIDGFANTTDSAKNTMYITGGKVNFAGFNMNSNVADFTDENGYARVLLRSDAELTITENSTIVAGSLFQTQSNMTLESGSTIKTWNFAVYDSTKEGVETIVNINGKVETTTIVLCSFYGNPLNLSVNAGGELNLATRDGGGERGMLNLQAGNMTVYGYVNANYTAGGGTGVIGAGDGYNVNLTIDGTYAADDNNNGKFINVGNQALVINNGSEVNVINGATFDWAGAATNKGTITVTDADFTVGALANSNAITVTGAEFVVNGAFTNAGTVALTGANLTAKDFANNATVTLDINTLITVGGTMTNSGTITIDALGYTGASKMVIDRSENSTLAGEFVLNAEPDYYLMISATGDVWVMKVPEVLYVNSDYSADNTPEGKIWGHDCFATYQQAMDFLKTNFAHNKTLTTSIVIEKSQSTDGNNFDIAHTSHYEGTQLVAGWDGVNIEIRKDGIMGNDLEKWDMVIDVTVNAGGKLLSAMQDGKNGEIRVRGDLTVGEAGAEDKAVVDFANQGVVSMSVYNGGNLKVVNTEFTVGDLSFTGTGSFADSTVTVLGALAFGKGLDGYSMTDTVMNVYGHGYMNEPTHYLPAGTGALLNNLEMTNSNIVIDDKVDATAADDVIIKNLDMTSSLVSVEANTAVAIEGNVEMTDSDLIAGDITFAATGKLVLDEKSSIEFNSIDISNGGSIAIDTDNYVSGTYNVLNYTGSETKAEEYYKELLGADKWNTNFLVYNSDLYVTNYTLDTIYVNTAWSVEKDGAIVGNGYIYGYNAVSNLDDAAAKIATAGSSTIVLESDIVSGSIEFVCTSKDLVFTAESAHTIEHNIAGKEWNFIGDTNNIIVGENVTFKLYANDNVFRVANGSNLVVEGTIEGGLNRGNLYLNGGAHTVAATGTVSTGKVQLIDTELSVAGDAAVERDNAHVDVMNLNLENSSVAISNAVVSAANANLDAYSTVVIENSKFTAAETVTNSGSITAKGVSSVNIAKLTGNAVALDNGTLTDSVIGGAVNALGNSAVTGTSKVSGIFSVGYYVAPADVTVTGSFNTTNALVGSKSSLLIGDASADRTDAFFGQLGAFGNVAINNADVDYDYTFIRNGFTATDSVLTNKKYETYTGGNAVIVIDNTVWNAGAYIRFGEYAGMYGNSDVTIKNGSTFNAGDLRLIEAEGKTVKLTVDGAYLNVTTSDIGSGAEAEFKNGAAVTAGTVTINGTLKLAGDSTLTASNLVKNESGKIVIDTTAFAGGTKKIIDQTSSTLAGLVEIEGNGANVHYSDDGDVTLTTETRSTVYINSNWAGNTEGLETVEGSGKVVGYNAYADIADAINELDSSVDKIVVEEGTSAGFYGFALNNGGITTENANGLVVDMGNNGVSISEAGLKYTVNGVPVDDIDQYANSQILDSYHDITIGKNVTVNADVIIGISTGKYIIDGTLNVNGGFMQGYSMDIAGAFNVSDLLSLREQIGGEFNVLEGGNLTVNRLFSDAGYKVNINGKAAIENINAGEISVGEAGELVIGEKAVIGELTNASDLVIGNGVTLESTEIINSGSIAVESGILTADSIVNTGSLTISGDSVVNATVTGDVTVSDGVVFTSSSKLVVDGNIAAEGNLTFDNTVVTATGTISVAGTLEIKGVTLPGVDSQVVVYAGNLEYGKLVILGSNVYDNSIVVDGYKYAVDTTNGITISAGSVIEEVEPVEVTINGVAQVANEYKFIFDLSSIGGAGGYTYDITAKDVFGTAIAGTFDAADNSFTFSEAATRTPVIFTVTAHDAYGQNTAVKETGTIEVKDYTAPTLTGVTSSENGETAIIIWSGADNYAVAGYIVTVNGEEFILNGAEVTSFEYTSATASGTYTYTVTAFDAAGNTVTSNEATFDIYFAMSCDKVTVTQTAGTYEFTVDANVINGDGNYTYAISKVTDSTGRELAFTSVGNKFTLTNDSDANADGIKVEMVVTDGASNTIGVAGNAAVIDYSAPEFTSITGNATAWTNKAVTLTAKAADNVEVALIQYKINNGEWQTGSSVTVDTNAKVTFKATDLAGNVTTESVVVDKIDTTAATLKVTGNATDWTNKAVVLTAKAADNAGIASVQYKVGNGAWQTGSVATVKSNATVTFKATDLAGNVTTESVVVDKIDTTAATLKVAGNATEWTNKPVTLTASAADNVKVASIQYKVGNGEWQTGSSVTVAANATVTFKATDLAGNVTTESVVVDKIDTAAPVVTTVTDTTGRTAIVTITATATDAASGVASLKYSLNGTDWLDYTEAVKVTRNGDVYFQSVDALGNKSEIATVTVNNIVDIESNLLGNGYSQIVGWDAARGGVGYVAYEGKAGAEWKGIWQWSSDEAAMWKVCAVGKFGSGSADNDGLLLYNANNNTFAAWTDLGKGDYGYESLCWVGSDFSTKCIANLDGDGIDDVLIFDGSGSFGAVLNAKEYKDIWHVDGTSTVELVGAGYFGAADGKDSLIVKNTASSTYEMWHNNGDIKTTWAWGGTVISAADSDWEIAAIGDFQGDGIDDIVMWQKSTGYMFAWENGKADNQRWVGALDNAGWEVAAVGDYNGDGKEDLLLRELTSGWGGLGYWGAANANNWNDLNARIESDNNGSKFSVIA